MQASLVEDISLLGSGVFPVGPESLEAKAENTGKSQMAMEKMVEGRLHKHYEDDNSKVEPHVFVHFAMPTYVNAGRTILCLEDPFDGDANDNYDDHFSKYTEMVTETRDNVELLNELDHYLMEFVEFQVTYTLDIQIDILAWWNFNGLNYPILLQIARDDLTSPVPTAAYEFAFSTREVTTNLQALVGENEFVKALAEDCVVAEKVILFKVENRPTPAEVMRMITNVYLNYI
ncbi:hypothetical protein WN943_000311 [Citrus x changshan-huyou]